MNFKFNIIIMGLFTGLIASELTANIMFAISVVLAIILIIVAITTDTVKTRIWTLTGTVALVVYANYLWSTKNEASPLSFVLGLFSSSDDSVKGSDEMYHELKTEVWNPQEDD